MTRLPTSTTSRRAPRQRRATFDRIVSARAGCGGGSSVMASLVPRRSGAGGTELSPRLRGIVRVLITTALVPFAAACAGPGDSPAGPDAAFQARARTVSDAWQTTVP